MRAPLFWKDKNIISSALLPVSRLYHCVAQRNNKSVIPYSLPVPVICIGNVVAGGAGKTPTALAIGSMLKAQGIEAHFLTRGYKGKLTGPVLVDAQQHTVQEVGDEALLLAEMLPTWVSRNRPEGGKAAVKAGAEFIIMDDGFQNPSLHKNISFLVIDGAYGLGNGLMIPAGPLREPVKNAADRASAILLFGEDSTHVLQHVSPYKSVLRAEIRPLASNAILHGKSVIAFVGIANPHKFRQTLNEIGTHVQRMAAFPDHHLFTRKEIESLLMQAQKSGHLLVTTAKDYVRLPKDLRVNIFPVKIEVVFDDPDAVWRTIFP